MDTKIDVHTRLSSANGDTSCTGRSSTTVPSDPNDNSTPRFLLLHGLGEGSAGCVYKAWDNVLQQHVAIKTFHPGYDADFETMRTEVQYARRLQHPGFVRLYDIVEHAGAPCISMEFVDGHTLRELLSAGRLPTDAIAQLGIQIAEALAYAHDHHIVHCDLKPENVLIADGLARLTDFGISISLHTHVHSGITRGTSAYMSPEQKQCLPVDHRTDIYSLGLMLAEAALGRLLTPNELLPTNRTQLEETMQEVSNPSLRNTILDCLHFNASERCRNAQAVVSALRCTTTNDARLECLSIIRKRPVEIALLTVLVLATCLLAMTVHYASYSPWTPQTIAILPISSSHQDLKLAHFLYDAVWSKVNGTKDRNVWMVPPGYKSVIPTVSYRAANSQISIVLHNSTECTIVTTHHWWWVLQRSTSVTISAQSPEVLFIRVLAALGHAGVPIDPEPTMIETALPGSESWGSLVDTNEVIRWSTPDVGKLLEATHKLDELIARRPTCQICYLRRAQGNMALYLADRDVRYVSKIKADVSMALSMSPSHDALFQTLHIYLGMNDGDAIANMLNARPELLLTQKGLAIEGRMCALHGISTFAVTTLKAALARNPLDSKTANQLGLSYFSSGNNREAARVFENMVRLDANNRTALNNLALALFRCDEIGRAKSLFERVIDLAPTSEAFANLGITVVYSGQPAVAVPLFERAAKLAPNSEEAAGYLAHAYRWSGFKHEANIAYGHAIDLALRELAGAPRKNVLPDLAVYSAALGRVNDVAKYLGLARREGNLTYFELDYADAWSRVLLGDRILATQTLTRIRHNGFDAVNLVRNPDFSSYRDTLTRIEHGD